MESEELILSAISNIDDKVDKMGESIGEVQVSVAKMEVSVKDIKEDVNGHLKDHKISRKTTIEKLFATGLSVIALVIAAWIIYKLGI